MDHSVFGLAMKINRHGRAKILTQQEILQLFAQGFDSERDKTLFGVCLFTAARIREACTLLSEDIYALAEYCLRLNHLKIWVCGDKGPFYRKILIDIPTDTCSLGGDEKC